MCKQQLGPIPAQAKGWGCCHASHLPHSRLPHCLPPRCSPCHLLHPPAVVVLQESSPPMTHRQRQYIAPVTDRIMPLQMLQALGPCHPPVLTAVGWEMLSSQNPGPSCACVCMMQSEYAVGVHQTPGSLFPHLATLSALLCLVHCLLRYACQQRLLLLLPALLSS